MTDSSSGNENEKSSYADIQFKVLYNSFIGQTLHICGNSKKLGNWDYKKSPELKTDDKNYPYWISTFKFNIKVGKTIEYKYVLINKDGTPIWDSLNKTRTLTLKRSGTFMILNSEGSSDLKIIDNSIYSRSIVNLYINNIKDKENNIDKILKYEKIFVKEDYENTVSELRPIDLISYENNKMTLDFLDDIDSGKIKLLDIDSIAMVTVYLPISVKKKGDSYEIVECENCLLFRYMNYLKMNGEKKIKWFGLLKDYYEKSDEEKENITDFLKEKNYYVIAPEKSKLDDFIYYIERVMYPAFLNSSFNPNNNIFADSKKYIDAFNKVNSVFAETILFSGDSEKDLITIHNIGLALVPNRLMLKKPNVHIGIYTHIKFPSTNILELLPYSDLILRCFTLCDVIGFHDFTSASFFLLAMQKIFNLFYTINKKGLITLNCSGRTILVHIQQSQLNYNYVRQLSESNEFKYYDDIYKKENKDYELCITSLDYLYCFSVICCKIKALDLFLSENKNLSKNTSLRMWIKEFVKKEKYSKELIEKKLENYKAKIEDMAKKVMDKYNNQKLIKIEYINDINDSQANNIFKRLALFKNTDILLYPKFFFTQGLIVKEFLSMQKGKQKNYGAIVSESMAFAGIKSLYSANAYDPGIIAKAMTNIYKWKFEQSRLKNDLEKIGFTEEKKIEKSTESINFQKNKIDWIDSFLLDLKTIKDKSPNSKLQKNQIKLGFVEILKYGEKFEDLKPDKLSEYYSNAKRRLLVFNYENTLKKIDEDFSKENTESLLKDSEKRKIISPGQRILSILKSLCSDKNNIVFIISNYDIRILEFLFEKVDNLGLSGENGFYYKYPGEKNFTPLVKLEDISWEKQKEQILKFIKHFSEKIEDTKIVEMTSNITWSCTLNNSYFDIQANALKMHLMSIIDTSSIDIIIQNDENNGTLSISPKNVNKGAFLAKILQDKLQDKTFDFIFVIGGEESDEEMFKYLKSAKKYFTNFHKEKKIKVISTTISEKISSADCYIKNIDDCLEMLDTLVHKEKNLEKHTQLNKKVYKSDFE